MNNIENASMWREYCEATARGYIDEAMKFKDNEEEYNRCCYMAKGVMLLAVEVAERDAAIEKHFADITAKAVTAAVRAEREACAAIANEWATDMQRRFGNGGPAAAILSRR